MNRATRSLIPFAALAVLLLAACKKEWDSPPARTIPVGSVLTVAELRALYQGTPVRFTEDKSVYAVVTADESNGNLYKEVYVQDHTAAINLRLPFPGGLYVGDSVRIYLPGTILGSYNGMLQLDSVDVDNNVFKQATQVFKEPELVTIAQITPAMQARLIRLDSVEFIVSELGLTYADAAGQLSENRTLTDCDNNTILVRTSGYCDFAGQQVAQGNGSFVGVVGQFNSDMQLYIRNLAEVDLDGARCTGVPDPPCTAVPTVNEDFNTLLDNVDIDLDCWNNVAQTGTRVWRGDIYQSEIYAQATAFQSTNATDVSWLISPPVEFSAGKTLSFQTQKAFGVSGHDAFAVFISTDFTGNNVATATWNPISCPYATSSTSDFVWVQSGTVLLDGYLPQGYTGDFVIGFRYTGSGPSGQTTNYRVDNVVIQ